MAETRGRLLAGELAAIDERLAQERETVARLAARRTSIDERLGSTEQARLAEEDSFARDARERERRAGRALRARYLGDRLAGCHRLIEQRGALLDEVRRAAEAGYEHAIALAKKYGIANATGGRLRVLLLEGSLERKVLGSRDFSVS